MKLRSRKKGFYLLLVFKSPSTAIKKLENYYKVFDPVVKYMVIKLEKEAGRGSIEVISCGKQPRQMLGMKKQSKKRGIARVQ